MTIRRWMRVLRMAVLAVATVAATTVPTAAPSAAATVSIGFAPSADASAASDKPATSYGTAAKLEVDGKPSKITFLRFDVSGIEGRVVKNARLRMYQVDSSTAGGRVVAMSNTTWTESLTWNTRPTADGPVVATFGAVASKTWYEVPLHNVTLADGAFSFAIDSTSSNGADWASRESANPPQLIADIENGESPPPPPEPGEIEVSTVAGPTEGSSDPTYYANNRHIAVTAGGRELAVHGRHATGIQLAWRDAGGSWQRTTNGAVADGLLLRNTGTGDWPASIAVGGDPSDQQAWVVWGGTLASNQSARPVQMLRLTNLDAPGGPWVDATVTIAEAGLGNGRIDLAFSRTDHGWLGAVAWVRKVSETTEQLVASSLEPSSTGGYALGPVIAVSAADSATKSATVVDTGSGLAIAGRGSGGRLQVWSPDATLTTWRGSSTGASVTSKAKPSAVALADGSVLIATDRDAGNAVVSVQRFTAGVPGAIELDAKGYAEPTVTTDGTNTTVVMVRKADGALVARTSSGGAWSDDRVLVDATAGGNYGWPNALRSTTDGTLRLVVRGPRGSTTNSATAVLALRTGL